MQLVDKSLVSSNPSLSLLFSPSLEINFLVKQNCLSSRDSHNLPFLWRLHLNLTFEFAQSLLVIQNSAHSQSLLGNCSEPSFSLEVCFLCSLSLLLQESGFTHLSTQENILSLSIFLSVSPPRSEIVKDKVLCFAVSIPSARFRIQWMLDNCAVGEWAQAEVNSMTWQLIQVSYLCLLFLITLEFYFYEMSEQYGGKVYIMASSCRHIHTEYCNLTSLGLWSRKHSWAGKEPRISIIWACSRNLRCHLKPSVI